MARMKGPKKINRYSDEFKIKAVKLANQPDVLAKGVAEEFTAYNFNCNYRKPITSW